MFLHHFPPLSITLSFHLSSHIFSLVVFWLSLCVPPDIPEDEAEYWTGKLDRINTMRIHDGVSSLQEWDEVCDWEMVKFMRSQRGGRCWKISWGSQRRRSGRRITLHHTFSTFSTFSSHIFYFITTRFIFSKQMFLLFLLFHDISSTLFFSIIYFWIYFITCFEFIL